MGDATPEAGKSYARRFIRGSSIVFAAIIVSNVVGLILRIFLARALTAAELGILYSVIGFISIFGLFRDFGVGQAFIRYIPEFAVRRQYNFVKSSMMILISVQAIFSAAVAVVLILFSNQISIVIFGTTVGAPAICILSGWFFLFAFFYTFKAAFQGFQDMVPFSVMGILEILLPFVFIVSFVWVLGANSTNAAFGYLIGLTISTVAAFFIFLKKYSGVLRARFETSKPLIKKLSSFALPAFIAGLASTVISYMHVLMINVLYSSTEAGIYFAAYPLAELLMFFPLAMGVVLFPVISELWTRKKHDIIEKGISTILKFSFILIVPIAFINLAFPETVISTLVGTKYLAGAMVLQIFTLVVIIQTLNVTLNRMILGVGKPVAAAIVTGVMAASVLVFNLILIPPYGIAGAAAATFFATLSSFATSLYFARKFVKFAVPSWPILKTIVGGVLTLLLVAGLKLIIDLPPIIELFVVMVPSMLFYVAWILLTRTLARGDLLLLKRSSVPIPKWLLRITRK